MVSKTSILLGANPDDYARNLLANKLISNWQSFGPVHAEATRILIIVEGDDQDYNNALDAVIAATANAHIAWRHEDFLTYGDPGINTWTPALAIPPNYVTPARQQV